MFTALTFRITKPSGITDMTAQPAISNVATPKSFVYSATSGNNKVYSNGGKTWYTKDGKKIQ